MTAAPRVRLRGLATAELPCRTRLPFRFGAVTVTAAPLLHLRAEIELDGGARAVGMASDLLVPKWFRKDVDRPPAADHAALRQSLVDAAAAYRTGGAATVFAHWRRVQDERIEALPPDHPELLERGYGIALVERALMDALCRAAGVTFWAAMRQNLFGRELLHRGHGDPAADLPPEPRRTIAVRHTVGRLDPLRAADIAAGDRLADGMPQALDEVLARHGVRWLKIKIGGGHDADLQRLCAIGRLLDDLGRDGVRVTLDGNEQFASFAELRALWLAVGGDRDGRSLLQRVQWVEQPLPRALHDRGDDDERDPRRWTFCPLVLDEGDVQLRTLEQSRYGGVSVKNCKGVLRAFGNREHCTGGPRAVRFQSSEDLTNLPVLALQQDLCTAACLDLAHSERNGHHYFPGLDHLPPSVVDAALAAHPDLYERTDRGARLGIAGGDLAVDSLLAVPGYACAQGVVDALDAALRWQPVA